MLTVVVPTLTICFFVVDTVAVENEYYKLVTRLGILKQLNTCSQLTVVKQKFITVNSIPDNKTTFQTASTQQSLTGRQGCVR